MSDADDPETDTTELVEKLRAQLHEQALLLEQLGLKPKQVENAAEEPIKLTNSHTHEVEEKNLDCARRISLDKVHADCVYVPNNVLSQIDMAKSSLKEYVDSICSYVKRYGKLKHANKKDVSGRAKLQLDSDAEDEDLVEEVNSPNELDEHILSEEACKQLLRDAWISDQRAFDRIDPQEYFDIHDEHVPEISIEDSFGDAEHQLRQHLACLGFCEPGSRDGTTVIQALTDSEKCILSAECTDKASNRFVSKLFAVEQTEPSNPVSEKAMKVELTTTQFAMSLDVLPSIKAFRLQQLQYKNNSKRKRRKLRETERVLERPSKEAWILSDEETEEVEDTNMDNLQPTPDNVKRSQVPEDSSSSDEGHVVLNEDMKRRIRSRVKAGYAAAHRIHPSQFSKDAWVEPPVATIGTGDKSDVPSSDPSIIEEALEREVQTLLEPESDNELLINDNTETERVESSFNGEKTENEDEDEDSHEGKLEGDNEEDDIIEAQHLSEVTADEVFTDEELEEGIAASKEKRKENWAQYRDKLQATIVSLENPEENAQIKDDRFNEGQVTESDLKDNAQSTFLSSTYAVLRRSIDSLLGLRRDAQEEYSESKAEHSEFDNSLEEHRDKKYSDTDHDSEPDPEASEVYLSEACNEDIVSCIERIRKVLPIPEKVFRRTNIHLTPETSISLRGANADTNSLEVELDHLCLDPKNQAEPWWKLNYMKASRSIALQHAIHTIDAVRTTIRSEPNFLEENGILEELNKSKALKVDIPLVTSDITQLLESSSLRELAESSIGQELVKSVVRLNVEIPAVFLLPVISPVPFETGLQPTEDFPAQPGMLIARQYVLGAQIGAASFSRTFVATEKNTGRLVCLKIMNNTRNMIDQGLDEIKFLKLLNDGDISDEFFVTRLYNYFYYKEHVFICIALGLMDLYSLCQVSWTQKPSAIVPATISNMLTGEYFSLKKIRSIARQILVALWYLRCQGITHNDIKPENILVERFEPIRVRLIDFGSSCYCHNEPPAYAQSRCYRAPEVILGLPYECFPSAPDMWSLACVLFECFTGRLLFSSRAVPVLLAHIQAICGFFPEDMLRQGRYTHKYFRLVAQVPSDPVAHLKDTSKLSSIKSPVVSGFVSHRIGVPDRELCRTEGQIETDQIEVSASTWYELYQSRDTSVYPNWGDLDSVLSSDGPKVEDPQLVEETLLRSRPTSILARLLFHENSRQDSQCQQLLKSLKDELEEKTAEIDLEYDKILQERSFALKAYSAHEELSMYSEDMLQKIADLEDYDEDTEYDDETDEDDIDVEAILNDIGNEDLLNGNAKMRAFSRRIKRLISYRGQCDPLTREEFAELEEAWKEKILELQAAESKIAEEYDEKSKELLAKNNLTPDAKTMTEGQAQRALLACHQREWPGMKVKAREVGEDRVEHILKFKAERKSLKPQSLQKLLPSLPKEAAVLNHEWNPMNSNARFFGSHHPAKLEPHDSIGLFANFLSQLLRIRPEERPTPEQALMHPFLWLVDDNEEWNL